MEIEATSFDQVSELADINFLSILVLDAIEETFQELVVLSFICEFVCVVGIECAHKLTEFLFIDAIRLTIHSIVAKILYKRLIETLLSIDIILGVDRA